MGPDQFSVRWTGQVKPAFSEQYTFFTNSDDGVRLWVNNQLIIDNWTNHAPTENSGMINLVTGQKYDVKMEYFENGGGAMATMSWSSASQPKQIVPKAKLYSSAAARKTNFTIGEAAAAFSIYPIPASDEVNINYIAFSDETVKVSLLNDLGQVATTSYINSNEGKNSLKMNISGLSAGLYILTVESVSGYYKAKLPILK